MDLKRPLSISLFTLFLAETLLGYIYIPYRAFHSRWIIALVAFLSIACLILLWRNSKAWRSKSIQAMLEAPFAWLTVITGGGLLMRLAWIIAVPPVQISDSLDYWNAAIRLVTEHAYYFQMDGGEVLKAWRPPGVPLILAAMFQTLGPHEWIPTLLNCSAYVATSLLLFVVTRRLVDTQAGLISVALLAVHPALIASTGLAVSEPLSLLLYLGCYWAGLAVLSGSAWWGLLAGALMALSALVKPEFELLPLLWLLFLSIYSTNLRHGLSRFVPVFLAFALTLTPWVVRNYLLFQRVVLISTNGGDVFYRANNPLASGGFNQSGARDLNQYQSDELLWSKTGYQWGFEWIRTQPVAFLKLVPRKQSLFFDDPGQQFIHYTFNQGDRKGSWALSLLIYLSLFWWIGLWISAGVGILLHRKLLTQSREFSLLLFFALYPLAVHSVFESQARYNVPVAGFLFILAALSLRSPPISTAATKRVHDSS